MVYFWLYEPPSDQSNSHYSWSNTIQAEEDPVSVLVTDDNTSWHFFASLFEGYFSRQGKILEGEHPVWDIEEDESSTIDADRNE